SRDRKPLDLPAASSLHPGVPRDLELLVEQMLLADPAQRPSALEVATRIAKTGAAQPQTRRVDRFVGRGRDVERLQRAIAGTSDRTRVIVVRGPSGVGKTALVEEALRRARIMGEAPELVWRGRCHERELVP